MADNNSPLITGKDQLIAFHASGARAPQDWRIGTEHEKFVYRTADRRAPSYAEPGGIRDLLLALTDHDQVAGVAAAGRAARELGMRFVPGVEISVTYSGQTVHIVGVDSDGRLAVQQGGKLYFYAVKEIRFLL